MTDEFVARSKAWLGRRDKSKPFFLYYAAQDIHVPRAPHPRFKGKRRSIDFKEFFPGVCFHE
jgi:hypothetical protein